MRHRRDGLLALTTVCSWRAANWFWREQSGATAVEYGLFTALVSVAALFALNALGIELTRLFTTLQDALARAP